MNTNKIDTGYWITKWQEQLHQRYVDQQRLIDVTVKMLRQIRDEDDPVIARWRLDNLITTYEDALANLDRAVLEDIEEHWEVDDD